MYIENTSQKKWGESIRKESFFTKSKIMEDVVSEKTADEVTNLKTRYQKNCRVMKNVGDFMYVISLQLPKRNVQLKFQLTAPYPQVIPGIAILSPDLSPDCIEELNVFLVEKANQLIEKHMIQDLVNECINWLTTNPNPENPSIGVGGKNSKSSRTKKKPKHGKKDLGTDEISEKKPSMRTAIDVISRIMWDESLPVEEFVVGYLDRFSGIQEKPFTAFSWEDVASVDYHTLAIPKHRICYFKYNTVKVWDKAERLDLVFGSTGDTITLSDIMLIHKTDSDLGKEYCSESVDLLSCKSLASFLPDWSHDFDDGFQEADTRANFFLALRIESEEIKARITKWQHSVLQELPSYRDCRIPPSLLHITLCALRLVTPDLVADAVQILESSKKELSEIVALACPLHIADIRHFSNRVLYAGVETPPQFLQLTDILKSRFLMKGLLHADHRETSQPHVTLFKLNQNVVHEVGAEMRNDQICERYSGYRFGEQKLDNLHLCSMDNVRQEDGFYKCPVSLRLEKNNQS